MQENVIDQIIEQVQAALAQSEAQLKADHEAKIMNQGGLNLLTNLKNGGYCVTAPADDSEHGEEPAIETPEDTAA